MIFYLRVLFQEVLEDRNQLVLIACVVDGLWGEDEIKLFLFPKNFRRYNLLKRFPVPREEPGICVALKLLSSSFHPCIRNTCAPSLGRILGYIEQSVGHCNVFQHLFVVVVEPNCWQKKERPWKVEKRKVFEVLHSVFTTSQNICTKSMLLKVKLR